MDKYCWLGWKFHSTPFHFLLFYDCSCLCTSSSYCFMYQLLSDAESARWLNHAIDKMWPVCMEKIVSKLLRPIIPWFLDKFKPWTVVWFPSFSLVLWFIFSILWHFTSNCYFNKVFLWQSHLVPLSRHSYRSILCSLPDVVILQSKASIQELYMGRNPPIFTSMRVLPETSDDDHLVGTTVVWSEYFLYFYGQLTIICIHFNLLSRFLSWDWIFFLLKIWVLYLLCSCTRVWDLEWLQICI